MSSHLVIKLKILFLLLIVFIFSGCINQGLDLVIPDKENITSSSSVQAVNMVDDVPPEVKTTEISNKEKYYKIVKVVDGDTIDVDINGKIERIRMIGINTPETVDPKKPVECFGKEASDKAKELLSGREVRLEVDTTQTDRDKYNRLLRYVWREDGLFYNLEIIKQGYAYEYIYDLPYRYQKEFKAAQNDAESKKLGLWANNACVQGEFGQNQAAVSSFSTSGSSSQSTEQSSTKTAPQAQAEKTSGVCLIKGNISSSKEKIYHVEGCGSYNKTVIDTDAGEKWFCTEDEAVKAGWRKAKNCP